MKILCYLSAIQLLLLFSGNAQGQSARRWYGNEELAFHKRCLVISLTEGITGADYGVKPLNILYHSHVSGAHDPLFIEYGFSQEWSAGIELSADIFDIDPSKYYGYTGSSGKVQVLMSDASLFLSHHFLVTDRFDFSGLFGAGISAVTINGKDGDSRYQYHSGGYVVRAGTRGTYYFWKGLGVTVMLSGFTNYNSSKNFQGNTFGKEYLTQIKGISWEAGLCYRFN